MPGQPGQGQYPPGMPMGQYYKVCCNLLHKCHTNHLSIFYTHLFLLEEGLELSQLALCEGQRQKNDQSLL